MDALLQQALNFLTQGAFTDARRCYERILAEQPGHFDALHMLGIVAAQSGDPALAVDLMGQALEIEPRNATIHVHQGNAWGVQKRWQEALACYERAIELKPDSVETHFARGMALRALDRPEEEIASYDRVIALDPAHAHAFNHRGIALRKLGRVSEALASHDQAIALKPDFVEAHFGRALSLRALGKPEDAIASYDRVLELDPGHADACNNRGTALQALGRHSDALASYDRAIALEPDFAQAYFNRGVSLVSLGRRKAAIRSCDEAIARNPRLTGAHVIRAGVLMKLGRLDEALASFDKAIALDPGNADAYINRGAMLKELGRPHEALASQDRALAIDPTLPEAHNGRGCALHDLAQPDAAVECYDRALALRRDYPIALWNKSLALLLQGNFTTGWPLYDRRLDIQELVTDRREFQEPRWTGEASLAGKTILLHAEQGLGDTIQFCRYARLVSERGARVVLQVQKPLVTLLWNLPGVTRLIRDGRTPPPFDFHCPLLSLPLAFGTTLDTIPHAASYLASEERRRGVFEALLGPRKRPRVGLAWSGNATQINDRNRSMPLETLIRHLPDGFDYVSLQKEIRGTDSSALNGSRIRHYGEHLGDFADTAALCDLMDVVISVDTSIAHLSGALGKPTWVLLSHSPDWRWLLDREDSPWYPTAKLYRQAADRKWEPVLERVGADLKTYLRQ